MTVTQPANDENPQSYLRQRRFGRECALQFLYQADQQDDWTCRPEALKCFRKQVKEIEDRPVNEQFENAWKFVLMLIRGVSEHRETIDSMVRDCAINWRLERMGVVDRNILRLAAFELFHCDDVPDVAAINEAIELAKQFGHKDSGRFVNGILDRLLQERKKNAGTPKSSKN